jgi:hypothetical protein
MTTEHMPGPWVLHGLHINVGDCYIVGKGAGSAEHMRRIVACVNACADIPTSHLEAASRNSAIQQIIEQRDALAEALRSIEACAKGGKAAASQWCKNLEGDFDTIEMYAHSALAKLS